jgi:hypothetical protein
MRQETPGLLRQNFPEQSYVGVKTLGPPHPTMSLEELSSYESFSRYFSPYVDYGARDMT